ncbi:hypothetical protein [Lutispora sp.]|uniref:hypothetical protein n=1 Tax=Lutispora sp. TaxID=2828727 RepID=UPI002B1F1A26|nr:hypothetical protein [Lutispora sp.]MEA4962218.1 hypothetical protein [Lutispora sp.]
MPKDKENFYDSFKNRYEELVFLRESYDNFNKLTQEDRGRIDRIFISIGLNKENWKDKNSTVFWQ